MNTLKQVTSLLLFCFSLFLVSCEKVDTDMSLVTNSGTEVAQTKAAEISSSDEIIYLNTLIKEIETLAEGGTLNKGQANALIVKIENAIKSFEKGNNNSAENQLSAFINEAEDYVEEGLLTEEQGETVINIADYAVHDISGSPTIADGLIAFYPFNESTNDGSGNNKHGESLNIAFTTDRAGKLSSGVYFNGDGYIRVPAIGQNNNSFSIALWYKTEQSGPILATDNIYMGPNIYNTYEYFIAVWNVSGGTYGTPNPAYFNNTWHHVVITHDANDSRIITYYDGIVESNRPNAPNFVGNSVDIYLGRYIEEEHLGYGVNPYFVGSIDDVYFFNRAISSSEVDQLYYYPNPSNIN